MQMIVRLLGTCHATLTGLVGLPARQLTSFMDDVDEVWLADAFLDQPNGIDRVC